MSRGTSGNDEGEDESRTNPGPQGIVLPKKVDLVCVCR